MKSLIWKGKNRRKNILCVHIYHAACARQQWRAQGNEAIDEMNKIGECECVNGAVDFFFAHFQAKTK